MKLLYDISSGNFYISFVDDDYMEYFVTFDSIKKNYCKSKKDSIFFRNIIYENEVSVNSIILDFNLFHDFFNISEDDVKLIKNYGKDNNIRFINIDNNLKLFSVTVLSNNNYYQYLFKEVPFIKKIKKLNCNIEDFSEFIYDDSSSEYYKLFIDPDIVNLKNHILIFQVEITKEEFDFRSLIHWKIFNESIESGTYNSEKLYDKFKDYIMYFEENAKSNTELTDLEEFYQLYYKRIKE